jgi:hypothetical protein
MYDMHLAGTISNVRHGGGVIHQTQPGKNQGLRSPGTLWSSNTAGKNGEKKP